MRRHTLIQMSMESSNPMRTSEVARHSSGIRYWLLMPFAGILIYGALIWSLIIGASYIPSTIRRWRHE